MKYKAIKIERVGSVGRITLNRPEKLNAITTEMLLELQHVMDDFEDDMKLRAVVITGEGRAFSAGFDIGPKDKALDSVESWSAHIKVGTDTWWRIWRSRMPYIAMVNGYCLGGACDLSMVCDFTVAAQSAQFGEPEIQFQSSSPFNIMPWVVGMKRTKEILLTGDKFSAEEAVRIGLATRVVPDEDLADITQKLADKLAKMPQGAMAFNKAGINRSYEAGGLKAGVDLSGEVFVLTMLTDSEERAEFKRVGAEQGMAAAFKWRDQRYADEGS
ncbi:MAG: enoyl-CoA hydratase/isomerase family protein [Actinobacteria bacterium]|nr:enoyl-CoA hydratase/isomerase family protein [Actinomycetota bacterium]